MIKAKQKTARGWSVFALIVPMIAFIAVSLPSQTVFAHGGENHGEAKAVVAATAGPRLTAQSDIFEIVAIPSSADGGKLALYLTDYWTNAPVVDAVIEVTAGDATEKAKAVAGRYEIPATYVTTPGHYPLTFAVTSGDRSDLLIGKLDIPEPAPPPVRHDSLWDHLRLDIPLLSTASPFLTALLAVAALALLVAASKGPVPLRRPALALFGLAAFSSAVLAASALTHRLGLASGSKEASTSILDQPESSRRQEDGSVFMPKPTQRVLDIRTLQSRPSETADKTVRLIGEVIPDPNRSGLVQTLLTGRIDPPAGGFPAVGSRVKAGDTLAVLTPTVQLVDQSDIRQTTGDLDRQITLAAAKLSRIERLKNVVPDAQISDARLELEGLRARRAAIKPVLAEQEQLKASVDGIVAQANVVSGQVVEAQTILFQIVDPDSLMVEAFAFDPVAAAGIEASRKPATAATSDGRNVSLTFAGRGLALRQQAIPLRFRVDSGGAKLNVGEPVTALVPINETVSAIPLPRASVVRSANGQPIVWSSAGAENFEPRVVTTVPIDAERVGVTAGLQGDARVVVRGAELISQVR